MNVLVRTTVISCVITLWAPTSVAVGLATLSTRPMVPTASSSLPATLASTTMTSTPLTGHALVRILQYQITHFCNRIPISHNYSYLYNIYKFLILCTTIYLLERNYFLFNLFCKVVHLTCLLKHILVVYARSGTTRLTSLFKLFSHFNLMTIFTMVTMGYRC